MTLRHLRLLFHPKHPEIIIQLHNPSPLQLLDRRLFMTHDTTRPLLFRKVHKLLKTEKQQIIRRHHQHIIINPELLHRKQQITHRPQPCLIRLSPIIHNPDGLLPSCHTGDRHCCDIIPIGCHSSACPQCDTNPLFENRRKPMIRNNHMLVYLRYPIDIIQHPPQNRILPNLQQRLRKFLRQLPQPRGVPRCNNNILHTV